MERHSDLNQPLQELLLAWGRSSPYIFQNLVCFKKFAVIEQRNTARKTCLIHEAIVAHGCKMPHVAIRNSIGRSRATLRFPIERNRSRRKRNKPLRAILRCFGTLVAPMKPKVMIV